MKNKENQDRCVVLISDIKKAVSSAKNNIDYASSDLEKLVNDINQINLDELPPELRTTLLQAMQSLTNAIEKLANEKITQALVKIIETRPQYEQDAAQDITHREAARAIYKEFDKIHDSFLEEQKKSNDDLSRLLSTGKLSKEQQEELDYSKKHNELSPKFLAEKENWRKIYAAWDKAEEQKSYATKRISYIEEKNFNLAKKGEENKALDQKDKKELEVDKIALIKLQKDLEDAKIEQAKIQKHFEERDVKKSLFQEMALKPSASMTQKQQSYINEVVIPNFKEVHGDKVDCSKIEQNNKITPKILSEAERGAKKIRANLLNNGILNSASQSNNGALPLKRVQDGKDNARDI